MSEQVREKQKSDLQGKKNEGEIKHRKSSGEERWKREGTGSFFSSCERRLYFLLLGSLQIFHVLSFFFMFFQKSYFLTLASWRGFISCD